MAEGRKDRKMTREAPMAIKGDEGLSAVAKVKHVSNCAVCSKTLPAPILKFPNFPLTDLFFSSREERYDFRFDLGFCICPNCGHAQLDTQVDPDLAYGEGFIFKSSNSPGQLKGINSFFLFLMQHSGKKHYDTIMEVGCNDFRLLKLLSNHATRLFGIDPIWASQDGKTIGKNINIIGRYVEEIDLAEALDHKIPDLILCRHTLEHLAEPKEIIRRLIEIATPETLFVFEFPILEGIVRYLRYNQIFHEHLHYWTHRSFEYLLKDFDCGIERVGVNCDEAWTSLMVLFRIKDRKKIPEKKIPDYQGISSDEVEKGFILFKDQMKLVKAWLDVVQDEKVCGYGAAVGPPLLAYHLGTNFQFLELIWDDDKEKDGLWYPSLPVQIKYPQEDLSLKEYHVLITEPDVARPIISRLKKFEAKQIIIPTFTL